MGGKERKQTVTEADFELVKSGSVHVKEKWTVVIRVPRIERRGKS